MNQDTNQEILNELRKLRRQSQLSVYLSLLALAVLAAYVAFLRPQLVRSTGVRDILAKQSPAVAQDAPSGVWPSIEAALDRGDNKGALSIARGFVARQPNYHYAHATLGSVLMATGDFTNAETAYQRAVELLPVEENEKMLTAIRKRLARERATPAQRK